MKDQSLAFIKDKEQFKKDEKEKKNFKNFTAPSKNIEMGDKNGSKN